MLTVPQAGVLELLEELECLRRRVVMLENRLREKEKGNEDEDL